MPAIVSNKLRLRNVRDFVKSVDVAAYPGFSSDANFPFPTATGNSPDTKYSNTSIYFFIGRVHRWDVAPDQKVGFSDSNPPPVKQTHSTIEYEPWRSMTSLQKISSGDVSILIKRNDWTTSAVYSQYDDQSESVVNLSSVDNPYYVYNGGSVFMCLDNVGGSLSIDAPTYASASAGGLANSFVTSDGYRWKFMYRISSDDSVQKFIFPNYLPIQSLSNTEVNGTAPTGWSELQEVMAYANTGKLETIVVEAGKQGSGYRGKSSGGGLTQDSITLNSLTASASLGFSTGDFNGLMIRVANSSFSHVAEITDGPVSGVPAKVEFSPAIPASIGVVAGAAKYSFSIGPRIGIIGDGVGAVAYSDVDSQGRITNIRIDDGGTGYSTANVTVNSTAGGSATVGVGAVARAIIPPSGGYGADPVKELGGYYAGLTAQLVNRGTQNSLPIGSSFRQIGIVRNPTINAGTYVANTGSEYRQMTNLIINTASPPVWIQPAARIKGTTSEAIAIVVDVNQDRGPGITAGESRVRVTNLVSNSTGGFFHPGESITQIDSTGAAIGTTQTLASKDPETVELLPNSGEILYLENKRPVTRILDQTQKYKIVIEF